MSAMFDACHASVEKFVAAFTPVEGQVGGVFFVNGRVAGLELFDASRTWRTLAPKLIRSYALDALDQTDDPVRSDAAAEATTLIHASTSSQKSVFPAVGEGEDVRFDGAGVLGAALIGFGKAIHVSAFSMGWTGTPAPVTHLQARRIAPPTPTVPGVSANRLPRLDELPSYILVATSLASPFSFRGDIGSVAIHVGTENPEFLRSRFRSRGDPGRSRNVPTGRRACLVVADTRVQGADLHLAVNKAVRPQISHDQLRTAPRGADRPIAARVTRAGDEVDFLDESLRRLAHHNEDLTCHERNLTGAPTTWKPNLRPLIATDCCGIDVPVPIDLRSAEKSNIDQATLQVEQKDLSE